MREQVKILNGTPHKRMVLSIVADYDLSRSICEMIDNAIDIWIKGRKRTQLNIDIDIDLIQKSITVYDNAGGVPEEELEVLISPGASTNHQDEETIGLFGVGVKRAVIALAQSIKISTRHERKQGFFIEFGEDWLQDDDWHLPCYKANSLSPGTTIIELNKLRINVQHADIDLLSNELSVIYSRFLKNKNVKITLNGKQIMPVDFDNWAYPPSYEPRRYSGDIELVPGRKIKIEVLAGLTKESSPSGEYGVYFYCNDRLIASAVKTAEVGFMKNIVGLPHPSLSIMRIIVSLNGAAKDMPWNSSKSDIYYSHPTFISLREWLLDIIKNMAQLSRRLEGNWPEAVFKYTEGKIQEISVPEFTPRKSYLIDLPPGQVRYVDAVKRRNAVVEESSPWTIGLVDGIIVTEYITKQKVPTKNRIALIVLDSTLEVAFKEYLVRNSGKHYKDADLKALFQSKHTLITELKKYFSNIPNSDWEKVKLYADLRNKLIHERATVEVLDEQIKDQKALVERFLKRLFGLNF